MAANPIEAENENEPDNEKPAAFKDGFDDYGIALHFVLSRPKDVKRFDKSSKSDKHFRSFERDLLSHVYRDDPGFFCRVIELPVELQTVTLHLPRVLSYVAESVDRDLTQLPETLDSSGGEERTRTLSMRASWIQFKSGVSIINLVFNPTKARVDPSEGTSTSGASEKQKLSEFDIIKLTKLWEGGESVGKDEDYDIHKKLLFSFAGDLANNPKKADSPTSIQDRMSIDRILTKVISHANKDLRQNGEQCLVDASATDLKNIVPKAGTIEIVVGQDKHTEIFKVLMDFASKGETEEEIEKLIERLQKSPRTTEDDVIFDELVYLQCILCGLLDTNIDWDEFGDVYEKPLAVSEDEFFAISKGTLLKFIRQDRSFESASKKIGVTPYLLLPQSILLHNEELLRIAAEQARAVDGIQQEKLLRKAELGLRGVLQGGLLANVFHYPTEKELYDVGHTSRGLTILQASLNQRLAEINGRLEEVVSKNGHLLNIGLAFVGVFLAIGQFVSGWEPIKEWLSIMGEPSLNEHGWVPLFGVPGTIFVVIGLVGGIFCWNGRRRG